MGNPPKEGHKEVCDQGTVHQPPSVNKVQPQLIHNVVPKGIVNKERLLTREYLLDAFTNVGMVDSAIAVNRPALLKTAAIRLCKYSGKVFLSFVKREQTWTTD